jgi:hypothetical protein
LPRWVPTPASTAPGPALGAVFEIGGVAELDGTVIVGSSAAFGKLIVDETEKWARVIRAANIKADWVAKWQHDIQFSLDDQIAFALARPLLLLRLGPAARSACATGHSLTRFSDRS